MGDPGAEEVAVIVRDLVNPGTVCTIQADLVVRIRQRHCTAVDVVRRDPERCTVGATEHGEALRRNRQSRDSERIAAFVAHDETREVDRGAGCVEDLEVFSVCIRDTYGICEIFRDNKIIGNEVFDRQVCRIRM